MDYEHVQLPGTGTVETYTTISQGGAPPEFVEYQAKSGEFQSAVVAFDGSKPDDSSVSVPIQVAATYECNVDNRTRVNVTIRRLYEQEGVIRYALKVIPSEDRR